MKKFLLLLLILVASSSMYAQKKESSVLDRIKVSTIGYFHYVGDLDNDDPEYNRFNLGRAYLTTKANITDFLEFRMTIDIYEDDDGYEERMKYLYAKFKMKELGFIYKPNIEFGLVHLPWMDFEQSVNVYRMQGKMFMERNGILSSADLGFTVAGYFGGEMDSKYKKEVSKKYAGLYGSFAMGFYNGPGYYGPEFNTDKVFQSRFTFRPLPYVIPGLQLSYSNVFGKGNPVYHNVEDKAVEDPDYNTHIGMLSYQSKHFIATAQYSSGAGDRWGEKESKGVYKDSKFFDYDKGEAKKYDGMSLFAEGRYEGFRAFFRYDDMNPEIEKDKIGYSSMIFGLGYNLGGKNIILLDYDQTSFDKEGTDDRKLIKLSMQVSF